MITPVNDIYDKVAQKYGYDPRMVKTIGDNVFAMTKQKMINLEEANIFLAGVGTFVLKNARIERIVQKYLKFRARTSKRTPSGLHVPIPENMKKIFSIYLRKVTIFKKLKAETAERQRAFCKKTFESYETTPDISLTTNKYTGNRG